MAEHIISKANLALLKSTKGGDENVIMTLGQVTKGDNKGSLYYWDALSTEPEDTSYYNVVQVTGITIGRWKKVFTRMITLPHGILVINNTKKEFFANTTTNASSEATLNLTMDNTTNGTAIFSEIWFDDSKATVNTSTSNDAVSSFRKVLSANLKQLTHGFYKGNSSTISVLGVSILGFRASGANVPVQFKIEGI